jgi:hypothetical protein
MTGEDATAWSLTRLNHASLIEGVSQRGCELRPDK